MKAVKPFTPDKEFIFPYPISRNSESIQEELIANKTMAVLTEGSAKATLLLKSWAYLTFLAQPEFERLLVDMFQLEVKYRFMTFRVTPKLEVELSVHEIAHAIGAPKVCPTSPDDPVFTSRAAKFDLFRRYLTQLREYLAVTQQKGDATGALESARDLAVKLKTEHNNTTVVKLRKAIKRVPRGTYGVLVRYKEGLSHVNTGVIHIPAGGNYGGEIGTCEFPDLGPDICLTKEDCLAKYTDLNSMFAAQLTLPVEVRLPYLSALQERLLQTSDHSIVEFYKDPTGTGARMMDEYKEAQKLVCCAAMRATDPISGKVVQIVIQIGYINLKTRYQTRQEVYWDVATAIPFICSGNYRQEVYEGFFLPEAVKQWGNSKELRNKASWYMTGIDSFQAFAKVYQLDLTKFNEDIGNALVLSKACFQPA